MVSSGAGDDGRPGFAAGAAPRYLQAKQVE